MDSFKTQFTRLENVKDNSVLSINSLINALNKQLETLHTKDLNIPGTCNINGDLNVRGNIFVADVTKELKEIT